MQKVKGRPKLVRDENSRAIINKDKTGLQAAKAAKKARLEQIAKEKHLQEKVDRLEKMMEMILEKLDNQG